jgi:hypothetical protein
MSGRKNFFLVMFRAELEDSLEDIKYLRDASENRYRDGEITSYVYNENSAFLQQEAARLKNLISLIDSFNSDDYPAVPDLARGMDDFLKRKIEEFDDPRAVYGIITRKLKKVLAYVEQDNVE